MMGRDKDGVDGAMTGFMSMLEADKDNVPALLGMSLAFTLENSPNKVRRGRMEVRRLKPLGGFVMPHWRSSDNRTHRLETIFERSVMLIYTAT